MDDARARHAAHARQAVAAMMQQGVDHGASLAARRRMHGQARRLVDDDQVLVLEQDRQRDGLGLRVGRFGRGDVESVVAGLGLRLAVAHGPAAQADAPLGDQGLDARPAEVGHGVGERLVDPAARRQRHHQGGGTRADLSLRAHVSSWRS